MTSLHGSERGDPIAPLDRATTLAIRGVARRVGLLAAVTPSNGPSERARLVGEIAAGRPPVPRWEYAGPRADASGPLRREVERLVGELSARRAEHPLLRLYLERCEEMALELAMVERVGEANFGELAARRFPTDRTETASAIARDFASSAPPADEAAEAKVDTSDGPEPTSLLSQVRALVGELRLPFRVEVRADLVPIAATGDGIILVTAGRRLTREAAIRTARHEVMGHAVPRARAARQPLGIFALGTAGGTDEQEGYALLLEERAGHLRGARALELAARHETVRAMRDGADFAEAVRSAMRDFGLDGPAAISVGERAYRGGDGKRSGLGREAVYLPALARVRAHLARRPEDEVVLASGQITVAAIPTLRGHVVDER